MMKFSYRYILFGIIVLSLILRLWGVGFGLPDLYHADEERIVNHALAFGMGDLNPHYFNYPSFSMYLLAFEYGLFFILGRLIGLFSSVSDFQKLFFSDPTSFYLIGRVTSALLGTATVGLLYLLGKKNYGRGAGLVAAFLLAITFLPAESSHFITTDNLLTFFIVASYLFIFSILKTGRTSAYLWAGLLAGWGAASKYNAATLALPILLAHWLGPLQTVNWRRRFFHRNLWMAGGAMLLTFFVFSPFCFLDFPKFWSDFWGIAKHMRVGVYSTGGGSQWGNYLSLFFRDRVYYSPWQWTTLGIFYLLGVIWSLKRFGRKEWVLLSYPLLYFLMVGNFGVCNPRYIIPVFPCLAVLSGGALMALWRRYGGNISGRIIISGLFLLFSILPVRNIVFNDIMLSRKDTRTETKEWIEQYLPQGTKIALEWDNNGTVQLQEIDRDIQRKVEGYRAGKLSTIHHTASQMAAVHQMRLAADRGKKYDIVRIGDVEGLTPVPSLYNLSKLGDSGVEYIVISSSIYNWFQNPKGRKRYPIHAAFYDKLFKDYTPLKIFCPHNQPGPTIKIYKVATEKGTS